MVHHHAVAAVERALRHSVDQLEGRHHSARRQHLDLQVAAGHVVDLLGEVESVLMKMSFCGQVLCQRIEIGPDWPLAIIGKPSTAAPPAATAALRTLRRDTLPLGWSWTLACSDMYDLLIVLLALLFETGNYASLLIYSSIISVNVQTLFRNRLFGVACRAIRNS